MIPIEQLKTLTNQMAYAMLLKDEKKLKIDISKLKIPKEFSTNLLSARMKSIFQIVFKGIDYTLNKERYYFRWNVSLNTIKDVCWEGDEFCDFFRNHPDIKKIEKKQKLSVYSYSRCFTVFSEKDIATLETVLEYNSQFLKEIRKYSRFARMVLGIYPEIKSQWQNRKTIDLQERYNKFKERRNKMKSRKKK